MNKKPGHKICKDGSSTLYSHTFGQFYHNPNGAVAESIHVFLKQNRLTERFLSQPEDEAIHILETGFGTGLNSYLIADFYLQNDLKFPLHIHSVEAFPISHETAGELNYGEKETAFDFGEIKKIFKDLKQGFNSFSLHPDKPIRIHLFIGDFDDWVPDTDEASFVFHDPFSPDTNPKLWSEAAFLKLFKHTEAEACLSTYSSASKARASMAAAGWLIYRVPGALGKREMSLAFKYKQNLPYKRVNEERLVRRLREGDFKV